jgi:phosphate transport system protein
MARTSFDEELKNLQNELIKMGTFVSESIDRAVASLANRDVELAKIVVMDDEIIDKYEQDIETRCLKLLATRQPMAVDLRTIGTALKIVTDLERMGDHASDIAKITIRLNGEPLIKPLVDIPRMAHISQIMVRESLEAFINQDIDLAYSMIERDNEVDSLYSQIFRELLTYMMEDPKTIKQATYLLFVAQFLERIGDHATNLGEWVIYMITGEKKELND